LRKEYRLRLSDSRVLSNIFGSEREEATGEWRRLHSEELYDLYSSPNIISFIIPRKIWGDEHEAFMQKKRNAYRILAGKPEGRRPP
jgi:hypothetical protein